MRVVHCRAPIPIPLLLIPLILGFAHCSPVGNSHEGRFVSGFETSAFYPCDSDEQWWVTADSTAWAELHAAPARRDSTGYIEVAAFVRIRGTVSPPGEYGHLGAYDRRIAVDEVLEVRAPEDATCR